jgi:hypothetical protein
LRLLLDASALGIRLRLGFAPVSLGPLKIVFHSLVGLRFALSSLAPKVESSLAFVGRSPACPCVLA